MLPAMDGINVVDLGCGFGWFCRWARERGAAHVLGLDVSERMLERARSAERPMAVSTWDGVIAPLEQAEPVDTAKPRRSSAITIASPSMPSNWMFAVLGVRLRR